MSALLILTMLLAFIASGAIALLGIQRNSSRLAIGGIFALIFFALQLGGSIERIIS